MLDVLPAEILCHVAFNMGLSAQDVAALACVSTWTARVLTGSAYVEARRASHAGLAACAAQGAYRAARMAVAYARFPRGTWVTDELSSALWTVAADSRGGAEAAALAAALIAAATDNDDDCMVFAGTMAIQSAAMAGNIDVLRVLLESDKFDPSADGEYALSEARIRGHGACAALLEAVGSR